MTVKNFAGAPPESKKRQKDISLNMFFDDNTLEWIWRTSKDFANLMSYYKCAIMEIETKFNVLNQEFSLKYDRNPISSIKTRLKNAISIKNKLQKRGYPLTVNSIEKNLNDVAGIRVVCSFIDDVYMVAEAFLKQDDIELLEVKDYIKNPKENGYRSLHLIVSVPIFLANEKKIMRAEIQIRTIAMDFWASLEHQLRYKKDFEFTDEMKKELFMCAEISSNLDMRMDNLRNAISKSEKHNKDKNLIL